MEGEDQCMLSLKHTFDTNPRWSISREVSLSVLERKPSLGRMDLVASFSRFHTKYIPPAVAPTTAANFIVSFELMIAAGGNGLDWHI
jgi:hypothetical protein